MCLCIWYEMRRSKMRTRAIIRKEIIHILRDPRSLVIIFIMPILLLVLFGYAITFEIRDIKLGIVDRDNTSSSRQLIAAFLNSGYFVPAAFPRNRDEIENLMMERKIGAALVIPKGFADECHSFRPGQIQMLIDGSNANTATVVLNYSSGVLLSYPQVGMKRNDHPPIELEPRIWYNPDLQSADFIVPGLIAVLMMMICTMLTSITIAREKETGTMEQILVSPVRSYEIVFGKVIPYVFVAFLVAAVVILFARLVFAVPVRGNISLLALLSLVFIYAALSIGVLISSRARTQQVAQMTSLLATLLPSLLLSGFLFPIDSMPRLLRILSMLVPAKYYLIIIRGILLKGVDARILAVPVFFLLLFGTMLLAISVKNFKTNLD
jgi:ABC-2 type transport system permease protein